MPQRVSVVIVDLDNTLFDWVHIWNACFSAMLESLVEQSGVSRDQLLSDFKSVHQRHGTSEYAFAIQELPSLQTAFPEDNLDERFAPAIDAFRAARQESLVLYPTVKETLHSLKDKGCLLVGYTESLAFYSAYRMRKLGLDLLIDFLYSPADHELPKDSRPEDIRQYESFAYQLRRTVHRHTPPGKLKPAPDVLSQIIADIGARKEEAIYVGDSLMKDAAMAQSAGVVDIWAKYGVATDRDSYELLRRVTHWTDDAVQREKALQAGDIVPTHVIERSFDELLLLFDFRSFRPDNERRALAVDIWKQVVAVQQHFNDISLRIRNFAVTLLVAVFGGAAFALKERTSFEIRAELVCIFLRWLRWLR